MFAAMIAALALAGAPATTPVTCASTSAWNAAGLTWGLSVPGYAPASPSIQLDPKTVCSGLLYASASQSERASLRRLNRYVWWDRLVGTALLVALHESEHAALDSRDECVVEKTALMKLPGLLDSLVPELHGAQLQAMQYNDSLPSAYHGC